MTDSWDVVDLLAEIADVGRDAVRGGYSRHVFDPAELELRAWFTRRAVALGLAVEPDRNGNLWARWGGPGPGRRHEHRSPATWRSGNTLTHRRVERQRNPRSM